MSFEIHPTAIVDSQSKLENGCTVGPYAIIEEGAILGSNCQIEAHAIIKKRTILGKEVKIGHFAVIGGDPQHLSFDSSLKSKVQVGDYVRIGEGVTVHRSILANGALVGGHVSIGANTFIGGGAGIHQFARIGQGVMIGGLAEVSKDVPPNVTISGRNLACGLNLIGMKRRRVSNEDTKALKHAYRSILMKRGNPLIHAEHCLKEAIISTSALAKEFVEFFLMEGRGFVKSKSQA